MKEQMISFLKACLLNVSAIFLVYYPLYAQADRAFAWGVNGHPLTQQAYKYRTLNDQIQLLKDLGVGYYRIDVPINAEGKARNEPYFLELLEKLKAAGVKPMPALFPSGIGGAESDSISIYNKYFSVGEKFINRYGGHLDVLEVGNEWDLKLMKKNARNDGRKASHYQTHLIGKQMWMLAGIIDGMKKRKSTLRVSMSLTWVHWYYLDILKQYAINYDIIGYHWYSNMGNITKAVGPYGNFLPKIAERYNKEIWITEFNTYRGNKNASFYKQDTYIKSSLTDIINQRLVKGFFIYELFDQPDLKAYPDEMSYGLVYFDTDSYKKKPIYYTFKEFIKMHK